MCSSFAVVLPLQAVAVHSGTSGDGQGARQDAAAATKQQSPWVAADVVLQDAAIAAAAKGAATGHEC
jgi:hypothetical protein